ncbi:hypothetical protein ACS5PU_17285 [Pedobacter sp. GSP4]|uniref:hypothetical protein n=1 Tax=Pedobacter sp. GSP4 TaxID=3453716 RepID=UPI003EE98130
MNSLLTKQVIDLHARGYQFDYEFIENCGFVCMQNNAVFLSDTVVVRLVAQGFDELSRCFKYVHTIETTTGEHGVIMVDFIFFGNKSNQ